MRAKRTALSTLGALVLGGAGLLGVMASRPSSTVAIRLPTGTQIVGTLQDSLSTKVNEEGDRVMIVTEEPLEVGNATLPAGMLLSGVITKENSGGRLGGKPSITIEFDLLALGGREYAIKTVPFKLKGKSGTSTTAKQVGAGAVVGGVIGAVAGSTVKGAVIGAVLGTGVALATDGKELEVPPGSRFRVQLAAPVDVDY